MLFSKDFLQEMDFEIVLEEIYDQRRWVTCFEQIFKHEGKLYRTHFERGSTEGQDNEPYEYEDDMIECDEVIAVEKLTIVYEAVEQR